MLHCTFSPHLLAQRGVPRASQGGGGGGGGGGVFNVTFLINNGHRNSIQFLFDMQRAGNANSNVSFQVNASFEQILFP